MDVKAFKTWRTYPGLTDDQRMFFIHSLYIDAIGLGELLPGPIVLAAKRAVAALDPLSVAGIAIREGLQADGQWPIPDGEESQLLTAYVAAQAIIAAKASEHNLSIAARYRSFLQASVEEG